MNSIWNNNISRFKTRFPQLAKLIQPQISLFENTQGTENQFALHTFWQVSQAKNGSFIAQEGSLRLHSAYNPERESSGLISAEQEKLKNAKAAVFLGFGLGYTAIQLSEAYPGLPVILLEPDVNHFLAALLYTDWQPVFNNPNLIIAVSCTPDQASTLINQYGIQDSVFFSVKAHTAHAQEYFDVIQALIQRNRHKEQINQATLNKFGKLWHSNCKKNAEMYNSLSPVLEYENTAAGKPFILLAAGPSLEEVLPHLKALSEKCVIVCVDTALRASLRAGVEPDFIVLTDPQYWAYRHIAGLKSPSSVLITELAVYPAVYRFNCKKIAVCNSQVPMAEEYSSLAKKKGDLGAGGSVASSAWNFCRLCGAKEIYVCGLDLSFPQKQTHIKGSTFEEAVHSTSIRIKPAQTQSMPLLFSGNACTEKDYNNNPLLTDHRMKMFAWWFESRLSECPEVKTFTFSPKGLKIPGIQVTSIQNLLNKTE